MANEAATGQVAEATKETEAIDKPILEWKIGKHVVKLREHVPAVMYWDERAGTLAGEPMSRQIAFLKPMVESWDWDGDPSNLDAWKQLDIGEVQALIALLADEFLEHGRRVTATAKN